MFSIASTRFTSAQHPAPRLGGCKAVQLQLLAVRRVRKHGHGVVDHFLEAELVNSQVEGRASKDAEGAAFRR
jgi:hypothetical protein